MPKPYPDPSFNDTTTFFSHANNVTDGWAFALLCFALPVIIFILLKRQDYRTSDSLLVSFFLGFFLSSLVWAAGLISGKIVVSFLLLSIAAGLYSALDN